jgi:cation:H+ antiporter
LIYPIATNAKALYRDAAMMMGSALLFTALALSGTIERWQGMLMVAILLTFSLFAFRAERKKGKANDPGDLPEELADEFKDTPQATWLAVLSVVGGIVSVVVGARLLVSAAIVTAKTLGVAEEVIGLTIVAVGTSLPELATALVAALRRHSEVAVGNIMGAGMYNLLAIMGLVGAVAPIPIPQQILVFDLWCMLAVTAMLLFFLLSRGGLSRPVGAMFLFGFVAYTALQYYGVERVFASQPTAQAASTPQSK